MAGKPAKLPSMDALAQEYRRGASYGVLGKKYRCSPSTIRNRLMAWAAAESVLWPLVQQERRSLDPKPHIVGAELAQAAILDACKRHCVSQKTLAKHIGISTNLVHKISSGHQPRIFRATQGLILEAACQLDAHEVVLARELVILPMRVRDRCPKGHVYDGRTYRGRRRCTQCWLAKERRRWQGDSVGQAS